MAAGEDGQNGAAFTDVDLNASAKPLPPASDGTDARGGDALERFTPRQREPRRRCMGPAEAFRWIAEHNFISKINRVVGWRFIFITFMLYGFDQGAIENLDDIAGPFWFKERGYEPADAERAIAWAGFSWEVKPIYGLVMDTMPLFGWHSKPYLIFFGIVSTAAYATIAVYKNVIEYSLMIVLMFCGMNSVVWNDIAVDGITSRNIKEYPEVDTELPSLQQFSFMSVGITFTALSGFMMDWVGIGWMYGICAIIKGMTTVSALWLPEKREKVGLSPREFVRHLRAVLSMFWNKPFMKMFLMTFMYDFNIGLFTVMMYWYDDVAKFSKPFIGMMNTIAYVVALVFIVIYATYLKKVRFRVIFIALQILQSALSALDILLVVVAKDAWWAHFLAIGDKAAVKVVSKCKVRSSPVSQVSVVSD